MPRPDPHPSLEAGCLGSSDQRPFHRTRRESRTYLGQSERRLSQRSFRLFSTRSGIHVRNLPFQSPGEGGEPTGPSSEIGRALEPGETVEGGCEVSIRPRYFGS
jgi:hypothetical protein